MTDEPSSSPPTQGAPDPPEPRAASAPTAAPSAPTDTLVQTALRRLPVPDHAPGFWEDLQVALAAEPRRQPVEPSLAVGPGRSASPREATDADRPPRPQRLVAAPSGPASATARATGGVDPSRRLVPPSLRRRSNVVLLVLLVAAVALVLGCAALLVRNRSDTGLGPSPARGAAAASVAPSAG